ncbi:vWA domain-containing protein [Desulforhopalus singaporensis]|uniref:Ca-activated chloride channel family protein n=1 Tax=Desulforhopalus singaporensis TaxID=91360 RepID=A0A1H0S6Y1_9BACT|nr:VWA domain-containing protein [Desulforhopalus singaporensis]SDP37405.1 Ca-activated chloride channel family protein [Desulforhopalus singaporensis]
MRLVHPEFLWLLALLPLVGLLRAGRGAAPALLFSSLSLAGALGEKKKAKVGRFAVVLRMATLALLIAALARPQLGTSTTEIKASGIDILLAVDVSSSMQAMDFTLDGKRVNRLQVVLKVVEEFIGQRPNDRIGLVAFSGRPYLVSPLTLDHDWLKKRLNSLEIGMIEDGTAIGSAIGSGINRLQARKAKSKILILLTDGINNSGRIPPRIAAEAAETLGIKVYTIGAGSRGEAPMPATDSFGRRRLVKAKVDIDEKTLKEVAEMTGALYFRATDTQSLEKIYHDINTMETTTRNIKNFENYRELFPYLLFGVFLLFSVELYQARKRVP